MDVCNIKKKWFQEKEIPTYKLDVLLRKIQSNKQAISSQQPTLGNDRRSIICVFAIHFFFICVFTININNIIGSNLSMSFLPVNMRSCPWCTPFHDVFVLCCLLLVFDLLAHLLLPHKGCELHSMWIMLAVQDMDFQLVSLSFRG